MKTIQEVFATDTLTLTECHDGFWLWDHTRKMNLSIRAFSEREALVYALEYYQQRLLDVERKHKDLSTKVDAFINAVRPEEELL